MGSRARAELVEVGAMAKAREEPPRQKRRLHEVSKRLPNPFKLKAAEERDGADQGKRRKGVKKLKREKKTEFGNGRGEEDAVARENSGGEIKKLKREAEENGNGREGEDAVEQKSKRKEAKKRKREKKAGEKGKGKEDEEGRGGEKVGVAESVSLSASSPFLLSTAPIDQQLQFFCKQFEFGNKFKISSLELEPVKGTCIAKLPKGVNQDVDALCKHVKDTFGPSWRSALCDGKLMEGEIDPGSPAILLISTSATRSLELLRGLRPLTMECRPAKLFAKHIKVEDQVSLLKSRVNIAGGTPSRIKKLMDMESLGLSRLSVIVLDMHRDAKGFSLFTLPQVRDEFWDLYRSHLHGRLIGGNLRICFYGSIPEKEYRKTLARGGS